MSVCHMLRKASGTPRCFWDTSLLASLPSIRQAPARIEKMPLRIAQSLHATLPASRRVPFSAASCPCCCGAHSLRQHRLHVCHHGYQRPLSWPSVSHKTPCHPSPQKQVGTPAQLREPTPTPLLYSRPVTRSPRKTPEGAKREEGGENAVFFLWGSRATGAPLSP